MNGATQPIWTGGINAVGEALAAGHVQHLYLDAHKTNKKLTALAERATALGIPVERVPAYELDLQLPGVRHQGVAARCHAPKQAASWQESIAGKTAPLLLILDSIQDPHNLGACLRSAAAAGVDAVLRPNSRSAELTPTVRKVACGAAERVPVYTVANLKREIAQMQQQGIWVIAGAGESSTSLYSLDLSVGLAIIVGNEGDGVRHGLREQCDYLAAIPIASGVESLNVSVACAIMLFEARRQRLSG